MKKEFIKISLLLIMLLITLVSINAQSENYIEFDSTTVFSCQTLSLDSKDKEVRRVVKQIPTQNHWKLLINGYYEFEVIPTEDKIWKWELIERSENSKQITAFDDWQIMTEYIISKIKRL